MEREQDYQVAEVFESLQGEGYNVGMAAVFLRFGRCNLACPWCDTAHDVYGTLDGDAVVARVTAFRAKNLIVTGGEPFLQEGLGALLARFKALGYWIGIETNGLLAPPQEWLRHIDYMAVSPKARVAERYLDTQMVRRADEVRIVVDGDVRAFCVAMRLRIRAAHYFLSPCERDGVHNIEETVRLLGVLNHGWRDGKWLLSLQTHKLGGFA